MWLMTQEGFFSVVEKPEDREEGKLTVRARTLSDIQALCGHFGLSEAQITQRVIDTADRADYRYRIRVTREEWSKVLTSMTAAIRYDNFKNRVGEVDAERVPLYERVWATLRGLQPKWRGPCAGRTGWPR